MSADDILTVDGNMYFLSRDEKYKEEKPYTLRYAPDDGFPQTNIERTEYSIKFHNIRTEQDLVYSRCGFQVANLQSRMRYEDYDDVEKIESIHQPEVAECVKKALRASSTEVLDYVVGHTICQNWSSVAAANGIHRYVVGIQLGQLLREKAMIFSNRHQELILVTFIFFYDFLQF